MKIFVTGDTHGSFTRFIDLPQNEKIGVLILGDVGLNFHLDEQDRLRKIDLTTLFPNMTFYCLRGNHEERPENCKTLNISLVYDKEIQGDVWVEKDFPNIKYLKNWGIYNFNGYKTLAIGGAYSVDKPFRQMHGYPWFESEQLTETEMEQCYNEMKGKEFDLVISHTCPYSWMPTDLFISGVNQSSVDYSMEKWLEKMKHDVKWFCWLFGHYHEDRIERPHVQLMFFEMIPLDEIMNRWKNYEETRHLVPWDLNKSPNYYMDDVWPLL